MGEVSAAAIHAELNLRRLVRARYALPGVDGYGFSRETRVASLVRFDAEAAHGPWLQLDPQAPLPDAPLVLLMPLQWAAGNPAAQQFCRTGSDLQAARPEPLSRVTAAQPDARAPDSRLAHLLPAGAGSTAPLGVLEPAEALRQLQRRRRRSRLLEEGAPQPPAFHAWPLQTWLQAPISDPQELGLTLVALLHLLPGDQAGGFLAVLEPLLVAGGCDPDPEHRGHCCRLLERLVGGLNSREESWQACGARLRAAGIAAARACTDPAQRGLLLMRLLQPGSTATGEDGREDGGEDSGEDGGSSDALVGDLAADIDALVRSIAAAQAAGDLAGRRERQQELQLIVRSGQRNLNLLRRLVLRLDPHSCYRLPTLLPPSGCLIWIKALLLLRSDQLAGEESATRKALVALFERCLPRVWWQRELLVNLLQDLRRFELDPGWLRDASPLLASLTVLHGRAWIPSGHCGPEGLLASQLTLLLRLCAAGEERAALLRSAGSVGKPALLRLLDREDEQAIVQAVAAGLPSRSLALLRLLGERRGVPALVPATLAGDGVAASFAAILESWQAETGPADEGAEPTTLPITVLITTHAPRLDLLRCALQSLALQSAQPQEVLLIDDGTPAEGAAALEQLVQRLAAELPRLPLRLHRQPGNRGQYACRNLGLELMTTETLAIQDDDDLSHPQRLARQWQALASGAVAVYAGHLRLSEATGLPQPDGPGGGFIGDGITTLLVRRSTAMELGGFYPVRSRGDVEFRERLRRRYGAARLVELDAPLYLMRGSAGTVSSGFEYGCSLGLQQWRELIERRWLV